MPRHEDQFHRPDSPMDLRRVMPSDPPPPRTMKGEEVTPHPDDPIPADEGGDRMTPRGLRDPGGPLSGMLAWLVILALAGFIFLGNNLSAQTLHNLAPVAFPAPTSTALDEVQAPDVQFVLTGRYIVGAGRLFASMPAPSGSNPADADPNANPGTDPDADPTGAPPIDPNSAAGMAASLIQQMDDFTGNDAAAHLRAAIVAGELVGPDGALDRIESAEDLLLTPPDPPIYDDAATEALVRDAESLRQIYSAGPDALPADRRDALVDHHGWFGRLATTFEQDDTSAERAAVLGSASRTTWTLVGAAVVAVGAFVTGFVLFVIAMVMIASGRMQWRYAPPAPGGSAYLEVFAVFLVGFLGVSIANQIIVGAGGPDLSAYLIWTLLLLPGWALVRGARSGEFRSALGLHAGRGVIREVFAGVVGYLAGLPVALLGIAMTFVCLIVAAHFASGNEPVQPTHPIMEQIGQGSVSAILGVYLLACVWAPVTEEIVFRGAFFHHLRGRLPAVLAGLLTGVIFAAIHPQGWVAIPALGSLGFIFAMLREWRGSMIAPIVAHAINNGFIMTLLVLAIG